MGFHQRYMIKFWISSPGVVQVRVPPFVDGSSPSSHDKFLDELVVVSHCPVAGFSSPSSQVGSPTTTDASRVGSGAGVSSGVGLGVSSGVGLGVSSGVGLGVSSGVGLGVSSGVGLGVSSGVIVVSSGDGVARVVVLSGVVAIVGLGVGDIEDAAVLSDDSKGGGNKGGLSED